MGRALAIAQLTRSEELEGWAERWITALQDRFSNEWQELAMHAGDVIHALLASPADLQQAADIANRGLLAAAQ